MNGMLPGDARKHYTLEKIHNSAEHRRSIRRKQMAGCGTHHYDNISRAKIEIMLNELISRGCIITGHNPWDVETHQHGVMLRGEWDEAALTLAVTVTDASWYVPCETAWENINALMRQVQEPGIELEIEIA